MREELTWHAEYAPTENCLFLSGSMPEAYLEECERDELLGVLVQPDSVRSGEAIRRHVERCSLWGADNGCFAKGPQFDERVWLRWLDGMPREGCLFAVLPDVLEDPVATYERSMPHVQAVKDMGFPVAWCAQDGVEQLRNHLPWDNFDCLFIGGSTEWKLSQAAVELGIEARERGKWTHVGRVNSWKRLRWAASLGFDSVDGTYLKYGPKVNLPRLLGWVDALRAQRFMHHQEWRIGGEGVS